MSSTKSHKLRPYQDKLIQQVLHELNAWYDSRALTSVSKKGARIMMQAATGSGKTLIGAHLLKKYLKPKARAKAVLRPCAWLTHRDILAEQTAARLTDIGLEVVTAEEFRKMTPRVFEQGKVTVVSPSLRTWPDYPKDGCGLLVVDEAHHSPAKTWLKVVEDWPGDVLALTATPSRLKKGEGFDTLFDGPLVTGPQIGELIYDGYLAQPILIDPGRFNAVMDRTKFRTLGGEYHKADVEKETIRILEMGTALKAWGVYTKNLIKGKRRTLWYVSSVKAADTLTQELRASGETAAMMIAETPTKERNEMLNEFRKGKIQHCVSVDVATEGVDIPECEIVAMLRPTQSLRNWLQMVGRGLRPHGEDKVLVLDFAGNSRTHGLPDKDREWSLVADPVEHSFQEIKLLDCRKNAGKEGEYCDAKHHISNRKCPGCGVNLWEHCYAGEQTSLTLDGVQRLIGCGRDRYWTQFPSGSSICHECREVQRETSRAERVIALSNLGDYELAELAGWNITEKGNYSFKNPKWRSKKRHTQNTMWKRAVWLSKKRRLTLPPDFERTEWKNVERVQTFAEAVEWAKPGSLDILSDVARARGIIMDTGSNNKSFYGAEDSNLFGDMINMTKQTISEEAQPTLISASELLASHVQPLPSGVVEQARGGWAGGTSKEKTIQEWSEQLEKSATIINKEEQQKMLTNYKLWLGIDEKIVNEIGVFPTKRQPPSPSSQNRPASVIVMRHPLQSVTDQAHGWVDRVRKSDAQKHWGGASTVNAPGTRVPFLGLKAFGKWTRGNIAQILITEGLSDWVTGLWACGEKAIVLGLLGATRGKGSLTGLLEAISPREESNILPWANGIKNIEAFQILTVFDGDAAGGVARRDCEKAIFDMQGDKYLLGAISLRHVIPTQGSDLREVSEGIRQTHGECAHKPQNTGKTSLWRYEACEQCRTKIVEWLANMTGEERIGKINSKKFSYEKQHPKEAT